MIAYQIIDRDARFTPFGQSLYALRYDEPKLYDALAKHILLNLHGMNMVQCILDMSGAGEEVNLTTLRDGLAARGIHYPPGSKHPSIMRLWLAMEYLATRLRGITTGGAEVDLIFHSTRLVYSRWQIQCKNTGRVALDDVAKEVGLTSFLKSNVIVIVSTGEIGNEARRYANSTMANTNLAIVMLDGIDLKRIMAQPFSIVEIFEREAHSAMRLKKLEIEK